ncbi:MAG: hypothetical protein ABFD07_18040 [Methanobacterium sp.]
MIQTIIFAIVSIVYVVIMYMILFMGILPVEYAFVMALFYIVMIPIWGIK